ncbi:MAG TPA: TIGR02266 family protein, partial [Aggregicoccus sp.]|nr:TIGR02266 family protein [Aggregicoccus sp.]
MSDAKLLPLRVRLPYQDEEEFLARYGTNVARGGVFIATRAPKPEGTALAFEFVLADGARMLRGEGVVVKVQGDEASGRTGMTVRFTRLDAPSKALVDRILARRAQGAKPAAPAPSPAPEPAPSASSEAQGAEAAPSVSTMMRLDSLPAPLAAAIQAGTTGAPASRPPPAAPPPPRPAAPPPGGAARVPAPARPAPAAPAPRTGPTGEPSAAAPAPSAAPAAPTTPPPSAERAPSAAPAPAAPPSADRGPALPRSEPAAPPARPAPQARGPEAESPRRREAGPVPGAAPLTPAPAGDEPVLGIDLGAHSARAAVFHEGRAQLVPLTDSGALSLPTAVALDPSGREFRVGQGALTNELYGAAVALPRLLGLRAPSASLQALVERM